jgi:hypothetical protein
MVVCSLNTSRSFAQPQKNVLRIWFDTITVKTLPAQVVMNCWFKIEGTKPHDLRGFQMPFIYESHQISPIGYYFSGTACEKAGFHTGNHNSQTGTGSVVVLGATELDLSKSLLFSIAYIAKTRLNDSSNNDFVGHMEVDTARLELSIESGIDEVVVSDGWIKYVKVPPPEPEKRKSIMLSSDSVVIASDSSAWLSLRTSEIDSARIKRTVFSFSVDTSVVVFDTAAVGSSFSSTASLVVENKLTTVNLYLTSTDDAMPLVGSGNLLKLKFTAHKREDTVSTHLFDSAFFALNADNLLDTVRYELEKITVNGIKTPTKTVEESKEIESNSISLIPNPADEFVLISSDVQGELIEIYSLLGEKVYSSQLNESIRLDTQGLPSGWYQVMMHRNGVLKQTKLLIRH